MDDEQLACNTTSDECYTIAKPAKTSQAIKAGTLPISAYFQRVKPLILQQTNSSTPLPLTELEIQLFWPPGWTSTCRFSAWKANGYGPIQTWHVKSQNLNCTAFKLPSFLMGFEGSTGKLVIQSLGAFSRKVSYQAPLRLAMTPCDEVDGAEDGLDGMLSSAGAGVCWNLIDPFWSKLQWCTMIYVQGDSDAFLFVFLETKLMTYHHGFTM